MAEWHMAVLPVPCLYFRTVIIMVLILEKANPPRGGGAKPRASREAEVAGVPKGAISEPVLFWTQSF
jgi:hypothetical protein